MRIQDLLGWSIPVVLLLLGLTGLLEGFRHGDLGKGLMGLGALAISAFLFADLLRRRDEWLSREAERKRAA